LKKPIPFGKYYLLERINVGGMAEVFKAKAFGVEGFERLLAVKRILPNIAEDEEFIAMFIDEAKIAVQLQHANIAQIFDLGKVEDSYFIALEYVLGRDLRAMFDRLQQRKELMPLAQACFIVMQVCEGLDYAHNKKDPQGHELHLVHRDISPQNVLVGFEGEVKLIDFGIAKAAGKASKTQAGILKGKFGYMSPEQVRGLPIDRRSDIFSVGIVLYELLTGERLFMGESDFSTLEKVRNVEILPPSSYNKTIPHELERIALKALAKDPEDRYQNAIDLHDDLQAFLYTKAEIYSRKDLAAWMKKTFPAEIEEESAKAEQFRLIVAPGSEAPVAPSSRRTMLGTGFNSAGVPGASGGGGVSGRVSGGQKGGKSAQNGNTGKRADNTGKTGKSGTMGLSRKNTLSGEPTTEGQGTNRSAAHRSGTGIAGAGAGSPPPGLRKPGSGTITRGKDEGGASSPPGGAAASREDMGWDDDELDTQIYEKEPVTDEAEMLDTRDLFEEDDDRTVANEPPPDILRAATAPSLATPEPSGSIRSEAKTPPSGSRITSPTGTTGARLPGPPSGSPKSLFGVPAPVLPTPSGAFRGANPTPTPGSLRSSRLSFPSVPAMPPRAQSGAFEAPGAGVPEVAGAKARRKSLALWAVVLLVVVLAGSTGTYFWSINRAGKLEVVTVPPDATILVDNVKVAEKSPYVVEQPPGSYTVSVVRAGYNRYDQSVEVRPGQPANIAVALEAAADTGFELTSEPPGGLVWLDGAPMSGPEGQARTDFRAYRIPPGKHLIEIKGDSRYFPWKQEVDVEAGGIKKVRATLVMVGSGGDRARPPVTATAAPAAPASGTSPSAPAAGAAAASTGDTVVAARPAPRPSAGASPSSGAGSGQAQAAGATSADGVSAAPDKAKLTDAQLAAAGAARRRRPGRDLGGDGTDATSAAGPGRLARAGAAGDDSTASSGGDCTITVGTRPWSEIWIDGKNTGRHTPYSENIPCGRHKLTFKRPDMNLDRTETVNVRSGETFKQSYALEPESPE
jgi:serine/threonine protein kinase